ncbi:MAG: pilus (MSHA type) biogenesis protein MshL [Nitrosomonadales bacterium]|nr:pilus (MSHA type) biogenesis protein MshL [Nitrosomonadales bacterium]
MRSRNLVCLYAAGTSIGIILSGCGTKPIKPADQHIQRPADLPEAAAPQPIKGSVILPPPKPAGKVDTYSVVVTDVPAQEILFALARDAKINLDIQAGIQGTVTVNAIDQTLPQILTRIARQVEMRYELNNGTLTVMPDTPYLHNYKIDYVNMARDSEGGISNTTQVGSNAPSGTTTSSGSGSNNSSLTIKNTSRNHFWETLTQNIKDILHETDKILPEGSSETSVQQTKEASSTGTGTQPASGKRKSAPRGGIENSPNPVNVEEGGMTIIKRNTFREAASVITNQENGIITVRATGKQHEKIQEFIDRVMSNAQRQVLIEATIAEVQLSDNYQQGIDWSGAKLGTAGFTLSQAGTTGLPSTPTGSMFTLNYLNPTSQLGSIAASLSLLESFGKVKVLSSPKLSVMNNQTAMLRVVDNKVYFIVNSTVAPCSPTPCQAIPTYTTTVHTVPIGFTMSVTPQINDSDTVLLNIRPSITRFLKNAPDPTPGLAIPNSVPQTSTREMESVLKIENNQIAVLGGLMEDRVDNYTDEVPLLGRIPILGNLFQHRNDTTTKTELVIFLRPVVLKTASVDADFREFRSSLPDQKFFQESAESHP